MRKSIPLAALILSVTMAVMPAVVSAQPIFPPGGGPRPHGGGMPHGGPGMPHRGGGWNRGGGGYDPGAAAAAGIIGLAVGAIAAGAASESNRSSYRSSNRHVERCMDTYRSYDPDTDTYIDRNGRERRCRL